MKDKNKYILHPSWIYSRDGDRHFISYHQLIHLYRLKPHQCYLVDTPGVPKDGIHLYPNSAGDYSLVRWDFDRIDPTEEGWYAVAYCWHPQEGVFVSSCYWNGVCWTAELPIIAFSSTPFKSDEEASTWASDNAPEG